MGSNDIELLIPDRVENNDDIFYEDDERTSLTGEGKSKNLIWGKVTKGWKFINRFKSGSFFV